MEKKAAKRWVIKGTVQGVGFRFFVQHKATSLGLSGWARNLNSGEVEVYAVGPEARLSDLASALYIGPSMAQIRGVEEHNAPVESLTSFSIH